MASTTRRSSATESVLLVRRERVEEVAGVTFVAYTSFTNPVEGNPADIAAEHRETERMPRSRRRSSAVVTTLAGPTT